jgi:hypothetical protein
MQSFHMRRSQPEASLATEDALNLRRGPVERTRRRLMSYRHVASERKGPMKVLPRLLCQSFLALAAAGPTLAACSLSRVTQMPLLSLGAHYAVMVGIEDVVRPMMVDTGSETTVLTANVVKELSLKADPDISHARPIAGIGQTNGDFHLNAIPSLLAFGDLVYHDRSTTVATMDEGKVPEADSIGLLGDDILSQFEVEFDFPSRLLTFYRTVGCYDTFLPWTGAYVSVPFDHRSAKVTIDVILNEERTPATVDTGNNVSFVSKRASALWGSYETDIVATKGSMKSPLNHAAAIPARAFVFGKVRIAGDLFVLKEMPIVDVDMPLAAANIGLDYWSARKIWISYPHGLMFVAADPDKARLRYPLIVAPTPAVTGGPN